MASRERPIPQGGNWLALMSFLLALAPVGAWCYLGYSVLAFLNDPMNAYVPYSDGPTPMSRIAHASVLWVLYVGSFFPSSGAMVTGWVALRRAEQYPPRRALTVLAVAGLVIGVVITTFLLCIGAFAGSAALFTSKVCFKGC